MACCLMAPSHYLSNQWGLLICEVLWHSSENNFIVKAQLTIYILYIDIWTWLSFKNYTLKITARSSRGQWVKSVIAPHMLQILSFWTFLLNCADVNATKHLWCSITIGSGNGLVPDWQCPNYIMSDHQFYCLLRCTYDIIKMTKYSKRHR